MRLIFAFLLATVVSFATAQETIETMIERGEVSSITTNRARLETTIEFAPAPLIFANIEIPVRENYVATWTINHASAEDLDAFVAAIDTTMVIIQSNVNRNIADLQERKAKIDRSKGKVPNARRN